MDTPRAPTAAVAAVDTDVAGARRKAVMALRRDTDKTEFMVCSDDTPCHWLNDTDVIELVKR